MRYRPFTVSGLSISVLTLVLDDTPMRGDGRTKLIYAALEAGINGFELNTSDPDVALDLGRAITAVGRRMVVVSLRLGPATVGSDSQTRTQSPFAADRLCKAIGAASARAEVERFDAVLLDSPQAGDLSHASVAMLEAAKTGGEMRMLGLSGSDPVTDGYMASGKFDLLATAFGVRSGWPERNRIKTAVELGMTVVGDDFDTAASPHTPAPVGRKGLGQLFRRPPAQSARAYGFMHETRNWTAEQIGLAFALTEPALATVRIKAQSLEHLQGLAAAVDRELPAGVSAQIEMARFSAVA